MGSQARSGRTLAHVRKTNPLFASPRVRLTVFNQPPWRDPSSWTLQKAPFKFVMYILTQPWKKQELRSLQRAVIICAGGPSGGSFHVLFATAHLGG